MFAIYCPHNPIDESHRTVSGCRQSLVGIQRDRFRVVDHKVLPYTKRVRVGERGRSQGHWGVALLMMAPDFLKYSIAMLSEKFAMKKRELDFISDTSLRVNPFLKHQRFASQQELRLIFEPIQLLPQNVFVQFDPPAWAISIYRCSWMNANDT
ncbi:hypothetical protein [Sinorhizobium meliloti]|uniref:hypothetical protein n=1 Tax=Rhizobium meliloti TaxID=382 RepID=UPI00131402CD|nr:hypothetical protein [Sinorhizobium meliloti]